MHTNAIQNLNSDRAAMGTYSTGSASHGQPCITTLYDLMTALQAAVEPDEDALVVACVVHMLRTGRLTWPCDNATATG